MRKNRQWRLNRAHMNCLENLPIFGALVLVATVAGLRAPLLDTVAKAYLAAWIGQSVTHVASGSVIAVNVRFTFFVVQVACLIQMLLMIWRSQ